MTIRPCKVIGLAAATCTVAFGVALGIAMPSAFAASHREAPFISSLPKVDATDLYMFRSYEAGRQDFVTILADYQPFQDPQAHLLQFVLRISGISDSSSTVRFENLWYFRGLRTLGERSDTPGDGLVQRQLAAQFWRRDGGSATPHAWNTLPTVPLASVRSV
jgi:hypothetical protein